MLEQLSRWTSNSRLRAWICEATQLCRPDRVHLCDGSAAEHGSILELLVGAGVFFPLQMDRHPASYWCHSDPEDTARVEECTFICSRTQEEAGPNNHWCDPAQMKEKLLCFFSGCMRGRVMYVIPFRMGPKGSGFSLVGVQITDSAYVAAHMYLMTQMGREVLEQLGDGAFIPCMHSVGVPMGPGDQDVTWPCNLSKRCIAHFLDEKSIWSFGSGYGGNALLGKKCLALRIASVLGRDEGWLAEHMLIMGITNPQGKKRYIAAAFPSACGKTNLALLSPTLPGWKVECVGDDIAWIRCNEEGRMMAVNPERGFFGVAPGTSVSSNPVAMQTIDSHTIFTNTAFTADRDVWWEGKTLKPPGGMIDWRAHPWSPGGGERAAHPNARFCVSITRCPILDPEWENPHGVPISAIIFGGRRAKRIPLVVEALSWRHGVLLGAGLTSETTAAAAGVIGKIRHDPFAMLPFCGYHMGDYFAHWLEMGQNLRRDLPRIFYVNWFRSDDNGQLLWPGFGENIRVLKWIFERLDDQVDAHLTPIGYVPTVAALDCRGLPIHETQLAALLAVEPREMGEEQRELEHYFTQFGDRLPDGLRQELHEWKQRLCGEG